MKLSEHLYIIGSDQLGLSSPRDSNVYLIDGGGELGLVDAGRAASFGTHVSNVRAHGYLPSRISKILLTHSDIGHAEGCASFARELGTEAYVSEHGSQLLKTGTSERLRALREYGIYDHRYRFPSVDGHHELGDGMTVRIGNVELKTIRIRGHSVDSLFFLGEIDGRRVLFTGDTVFYGGRIGLVNLPGCSIDNYRQDVPRLSGLNVDVLLPAHGIFVLDGGQRHLDTVVSAFRGVGLPSNHEFAI